MRILMLSSDPTILDPGSAAGKRLASYRAFADIRVLLRGGDFFKTLKEGGEVLNDFKPDLVSAQDPFFTGLIGLMLAEKVQVPLQVQVHTDFLNPSYFLESPKHLAHLFLALWVLPRAGCVRVVSERVMRSVQKLTDAPISVLPIRVVPPIVESRVYERAAAPSLLTVSRLTHEKRVHLALEALLYLPEAHLTIVGDGPLRKSLESRVQSLELKDRVTFAGFQSDLAPYYRAANVFVSTSRYEGYGMALMEAALAGLPIVTTDVGIVGEILRDGAEALVADASLRDVADAVKRASDPVLAERIGKAARARAAGLVLSEESYLARYREALHTCLS